MTTVSFDPTNVVCAQWRKIWRDYKISSTSAGHCAVCKYRASLRCSGCFEVWYCSSQHQREHWKSTHRLQCAPYKIVQGDKSVGRFVVATRDILPGEVIFQEAPITFGPRQFTHPVCLGCHIKVEDELSKCPECQWLMCGNQKCLESPLHKLECKVLSGCKFKPKIKGSPNDANPIYECLTPLRCLLIQKASLRNWHVMMAMEQHTEEREKEVVYAVNQTNTVQFIQKFMPALSNQFSDEEINAVINVLDVNAFEMRGHGFSVRGVYPLTAMMNSICHPNTQNCIDRDLVCRVTAARTIRKGEEITTCYTFTLSGTAYRRKQLRETKYFDCICQRCQDPTEFGSHFSSVACQREKCHGFVCDTNPMDPKAPWTCSQCSEVMTKDDIEIFISKIEEENQSIPCDKHLLEKQLDKLDKILHPNHYLRMDLLFTLGQLYGSDRLNDKEMMREARSKKQERHYIQNP